MRIREYNALWGRAMEELRGVETDLEAVGKNGDLAGLVYLPMASLSPGQHDRVLTSLPDAHFPVNAIHIKLAQFFPNLQERESVYSPLEMLREWGRGRDHRKQYYKKHGKLLTKDSFKAFCKEITGLCLKQVMQNHNESSSFIDNFVLRYMKEQHIL